ncbi:P-loop containing nucleoside triphosphate hydrolase protein [Schizophyllum amplum]|uniref:RNA helicase n=1 Tax=Schizophyllum amplum TaxID=97359 RepID=A0A550C8G8_9AGAR|nr:P-loop containing nucleoside triphosphate hydrolase protein [Auriculariopsis ampla]
MYRRFFPQRRKVSAGDAPLDDALYGFVPSHVTGDQVRRAQDHTISPFTQRRYTPRYKELHSQRKALPAYQQMDEILHQINMQQVTLITGAVGSGKTTQVPQLVLYADMPHKKSKTIACVQPRKLMTAIQAHRVAQELEVSIGEHVGYSSVFEHKTSRQTALVCITAEALVREMLSDRYLTRYSVIILDDIHERSLYSDLLVCLLRDVVRQRSDVKLVLLSALDDTSLYENYYGNRISLGKLHLTSSTYTVHTHYAREPSPNLVEEALGLIMDIHITQQPGDILLYLTEKEEIQHVCELIHDATDPGLPPLAAIPLHDTMTPSDIHARIYATTHGPARRRVFVSTDAAESALCIPSVAYVIDPGLHKRQIFDPQSRAYSSRVMPIDKASGSLRKYAACHTRPGKCFRLLSREDYHENLEEEVMPEIATTNVITAVLLLINLGVENVLRFDFLDPPCPGALEGAIELLTHLKAVDSAGKLTHLGEVMAQIPVAPQLAKALRASPTFHCFSEMLKISAMLHVQTQQEIFRRPPDCEEEAQIAHRLLATSQTSDHLTLLNIYDTYTPPFADRHGRDWSDKMYLSQDALEEAILVRDRLEKIMLRIDPSLSSPSQSRTPAELHRGIGRSLVCGFFTQVAHRDEGTYMTFQNDIPSILHVDSGIEAAPDWVVYHQLDLSPHLTLRTVTAIDPAWCV